MIQAERVEIRLCKVYAELMCYGTGTIWVSHFSNLMKLIRLCPSGYVCLMLNTIDNASVGLAVTGSRE